MRPAWLRAADTRCRSRRRTARRCASRGTWPRFRPSTRGQSGAACCSSAAPADTSACRWLPSSSIRNRLLRRALSFEPQAVVANGDHVYWDLLAPAAPDAWRLAGSERIAGRFDRSALVFGHTNETVLKLAAGPQIVPVYGTDFRSTPVFFLQDDHDYFDNDEATDEIVTFPPSPFMLRLARAAQRLYYPEFLADAGRPPGLPWSSAGDGGDWLSESFGTLRFGRLLEILLYDVRRTVTLAGPSAVFVDPEVERGCARARRRPT